MTRLRKRDNLTRWQPPVAVASPRCSRVATAAAPVDGDRGHGRGSGARTKDLVKRPAPGDIAVIDHVNIDRIAAEELIATGVARGAQRLAVLRRPLSRTPARCCWPGPASGWSTSTGRATPSSCCATATG